jgi:hypothetical protein
LARCARVDPAGFLPAEEAMMGLFGWAGDEANLESVKGLSLSRDFRHAHPKLLERWKELLQAHARNFPQREVLVTCIYRSPEEQAALWLSGRFGNPGPILVDCDGRNTLSPLNFYPSRGLHAVVLERGILIEDEPPYYPLGALARQCGLSWRGFWREGQPAGALRDKTLFELADGW